jgi:alkaline phosphatase D
MSKDVAPYVNASDAFKIYHADVNYDSAEKGQHYYEFRRGDIAYFVMDTRRYRSGMTEGLTTRTMLGETQLASLYQWLGKVLPLIRDHIAEG